MKFNKCMHFTCNGLIYSSKSATMLLHWASYVWIYFSQIATFNVANTLHILWYTLSRMCTYVQRVHVLNRWINSIFFKGPSDAINFMRLKWYFLYGIYCVLVLYLRHSTKQSGQPYIVKRVVGRYQIQRERE